VFSQIDGARHKILEFKGALAGVLNEFYIQNALYGETAEDAYRVDVGESVNTPTTIANAELNAIVGIKMSPYAELVYISISKTPINQSV
jgi:hypothetical protein